MIDELLVGLGRKSRSRARDRAGDGLAIHAVDIRDAQTIVDDRRRRSPRSSSTSPRRPTCACRSNSPVLDAQINVIGTLQRARGRAAGRRPQGRRRIERRHDLRRARPDALPVDEPHPQHPVSPYGVGKKVVGDYMFAYRAAARLEFTALALANVYGPRQDPHGEAGVVAIFAGRLLTGEPCTIFGDGEQTRDFVYVDDVVDAFVRAAERGGGLVINIGTGVETSVNTLYRRWPTPPASTAEPTRAPPGRASSTARRWRSARAGNRAGLAAVDDLADGIAASPRLVPRPSCR